MEASTIDILTREIARLLAPLKTGLAGPRQGRLLINSLGWELPPGVEDLGIAVSGIEDVLEKLKNILQSTSEEQNDIMLMAERYAGLLSALSTLLRNIHNSIDVVSDISGVTNDYLLKTRIKEEFFVRLIDMLIIKYLQNSYYPLFASLELLGVISIEKKDADTDNFQTGHLRYKIEYPMLLKIFSDPLNIAEEVYGWGTDHIKLELFLTNLAKFIIAFGGEAYLRELPLKVEEKITGIAGGVNPLPQVVVHLLKGLGNDETDIGLSLFGLRETSAGSTDAGMAFSPFIRGTADLTFPLTDRLAFEVESEIDLQDGIVLSIRPDQGMQILSGLFSEGSDGWSSTGKLKLIFAFSEKEANKITILSLPGGSDLTAEKLYVASGIGLTGSNTFDFFVEAGILKGVFSFKAEGADGFLSQILPSDGLNSNFDIIVGWSRQQGVYFKGSGGLEIELPVHLSLGPLDISGLYFRLGVDGKTLPLEISSSFAVKMGPLFAAVDHIGVEARFGFPDNRKGNAGPVDIDFGFKPPNGVALSVDATVVKGAGYLFFDHDRGEYAGALELTFQDFLSLKAIGLISTKMPDGSDGFSLLIIITAEFTIQIGMGFVFLGAGGLLGLHRTAKLTPLAEGVRSGATANILFPTNVVENAPRIISDIKVFFPIEQNHFLIGPMIKLGWGQPALISLSVGIILEIKTDDGGNLERIAILGVIKCILPEEDKAVLALQVNFIGAVDFTTKRAFFFASLFDSRILAFTIEGEMGVLVAWGDNPDFIISVGGFHPRFSPPPLPFPVPRRVAISILNKSWGKIRLEGYFAITTNTVQFGSKIDIWFKFSEFRIEGYLGFDALFQFDPFYFIIEISGKVSLKVFGAGLFSITAKFSLEGPTPWRAKGYGKIKILFVTFKARFDKKWGESKNTTLPPVEVIPILAKEFNNSQNWQAVLPPYGSILVTLRDLEAQNSAGGTDIIMHPVGQIKISQRAVLLDKKIDKVGNQKPADANRFELKFDGGNFSFDKDAKESFAPGQFFDMGPSELLSKPATKKYKGGAYLKPDNGSIRSSTAVVRHVRYEEIIIDTAFKRVFHGFIRGVTSLFSLFLHNNAASRSLLSDRFRKEHQPFDKKVTIREGSFMVVNAMNNKPYKPDVAFDTHSEAEHFLANEVMNNPEMTGALQILPANEVNITV